MTRLPCLTNVAAMFDKHGKAKKNEKQPVLALTLRLSFVVDVTDDMLKDTIVSQILNVMGIDIVTTRDEKKYMVVVHLGREKFRFGSKLKEKEKKIKLFSIYK